MTVTLLTTITLTILAAVLVATLTLASMLLAEEANDRRDRRDRAGQNRIPAQSREPERGRRAQGRAEEI